MDSAISQHRSLTPSKVRDDSQINAEPDTTHPPRTPPKKLPVPPRRLSAILPDHGSTCSGVQSGVGRCGVADAPIQDRPVTGRFFDVRDGRADLFYGRKRADLFDGRKRVDFFTYHGFLTITSSSHIISRDISGILKI
jgi:hypothetical protein